MRKREPADSLVAERTPAKMLFFPSSSIEDQALSILPPVALAIDQGERDADCLSAIANDYLAQRDLLYLLSVMCCPDDEEVRARFWQALTLEDIHLSVEATTKLGIKTTVSGDLYLSIIGRQDPRQLMELMLDANWLAHIACGYILRRVVSMHRNEGPRGFASLTNAAEMVEQWCRENGNLRGGKAQNVIRNLWPKYKSVSHLWAAWFVLSDADLLPESLGFPNFVTMLCGTAQWLAEQAVQIQPKHRRRDEALLALDDLWTIPHAHVPRLTDGSPANRIWNEDLDAHDLRKKLLPPARQRV